MEKQKQIKLVELNKQNKVTKIDIKQQQKYLNDYAECILKPKLFYNKNNK